MNCVNIRMHGATIKKWLCCITDCMFKSHFGKGTYLYLAQDNGSKF